MKRMNLRNWITFICTVIILAIVLTPIFARAQTQTVEYQAQISIDFDHGEHPRNMANGGYNAYLGPDEGGPWPTMESISYDTAEVMGVTPTGLTSYQIENILFPINNPQMLSSVTRYIVLTAFDGYNAESGPSNEVPVVLTFALKSITELKVIFKAFIKVIIGQ